MASQAYYDWLAAGRPYETCRPGQDLAAVFLRAGYTVYMYPDEAHQKAEPPQDHTPYSATGWPLPSQRWIGHAIDIMPKAGLMPLHDVADRIIRAKNSSTNGTQPIKYMNYTNAGGACYHASWQPDYKVTTSADRGHIHISFRSDMDASDVVYRSGWNPLTGGAVTLPANFATDFAALIYRMEAVSKNLDTVRGSSVAGENNALKDSITDLSVALAAIRGQLDGIHVTGPELVTAFMNALLADPTAVDALATTVASRVGMIPTATEIAKAIGELSWHGRIES